MQTTEKTIVKTSTSSTQTTALPTTIETTTPPTTGSRTAKPTTQRPTNEGIIQAHVCQSLSSFLMAYIYIYSP